MNILFVMDDIASIHPKKDTTLAMLRAAKELGHSLYVCDTNDISYSHEEGVFATLTAIEICSSDDNDDNTAYYTELATRRMPLEHMAAIIMRKDPPFDMNYIYATYMLELVHNNGVKVVNNPRSLRDFNEKVVLSRFPHLCVPTLISSSLEVIEQFRRDFATSILKPLDAMGGSDIYKKDSHEDISSEVQHLSNDFTTPLMVQRFIPEISDGDKRIILIGGELVDYALARIPKAGSFKGNLAQGASYEVRALTSRDRYICNEIKPLLQAYGLDFVGIDVIGEYLTEINITSPTGVREIDTAKGTNLALDFMRHVLTDL